MTHVEPCYAELLDAIPHLRNFHARDTPVYSFLDGVARSEAKAHFDESVSGAQPFGQFGDIVFPFFSMGAVTSVDLFGLDELLIFSFYWANRDRYRRVGDLGANIGIHSIMLDRCGYEIKAFEPDNVHFDLLRNNLDANNCKNVTPIMKAVSTQDGELEYVRVLGNTTGSHLAGSKENPYGELETFTVPTLNIAGIMAWADLIKMDIEGHEKQVLLATSSDDWQGTDAFVEIGTAETASLVFTHLSSLGVNMFAQKINWVKVEKSSDLPTSYREGSLFLTLNSDMPWHTANLSEATGSERF